ncbi:hypothetical protein MESS4_750309 [Mesorhizobium sp. STM 4661]|nr:hypothetical protein MESS4_750309 [Mesorhizobium sp. STM 4661]
MQMVPLMAATAEWGDEESAFASSLFARTEEKIRLCQS